MMDPPDSTLVLSSSTPVSVLPTSDPTPLKFIGIRNLFRTIDTTSGDFLVVTDVSLTDFESISAEREKPSFGRRRKFRLRRYHADQKILIVTIPTEAHELLHLGLYESFRDKIVQRGMRENWQSLGTRTFRAQGHRPGDGCEGDSTGRPRPSPNPWPTLVIEAGVSGSLGELHNDMRWWFHISDHHVNIVLLAKIEQARQEIRIERWEEVSPTRTGATTTRRFAASTSGLSPTLQQAIVIRKDRTTTPATYNITRGVLVLSFRLLFLREQGPNESNIIIDIPALEDYADRVWASL